MVIAADEQPHRFFGLAAGACLAAGASTGGLKFTDRHPLEVAVLSQQHDRALIGDQIDVIKTSFEVQDLGATRGVMALLELTQLALDNAKHPLTAGQDVLVIGDLGQQILVLKADLVGFQRREAAQLHLQDRVSLDLGEAMAGDELLPGRGRISGIADQLNDGVEIIEGHQQALQDVVAFFCFTQQEARATFNRLDAEIEKHLKHALEIEQHRLTFDERQHVGAEVVLQWGEFEQVVQHHLGVGVPAQFDHDAHAIAVAFIADVSDALELLVVDHLSNALNQ